jgi:hypothetical protein
MRAATEPGGLARGKLSTVSGDKSAEKISGEQNFLGILPVS